MPIYLDNPPPNSEHDLFGAVPAKTGPRSPRARQQIVWCAKCDKLDSVFFWGGVSLSSKRCPTCRGELVTNRSRSAKLKFFDAIMTRNISLVIAAAHGQGDIETAVQYAEYAAHTCFGFRLVPYGPGPKR